jgi:hypothetical protein
MTRGIPWDDLPNMYKDSRKNNNNMILKEVSNNNKEVKTKAPHVFHLANDLTSIGKRLAFGVTVSLLLTIQLYQCFIT